MSKFLEGYIIRYIKTKNKIRKIITYADNSGDQRVYQQKVVEFVRENTVNSTFSKAYSKHSSIRQNAKAHLYNDIFIKLDIKDFFQSINHKKLADCLYREINKSTEISYRECCEVVRKCSVSNKGLPLGLVSSPDLANLYLKEFDGLFYGYIKTLGLENPIYTRYADDLVVSYKSPAQSEIADKIINKAEQLLRRFSLKLNYKKTKIVDLNKSNHVRITGISITKTPDNYRHLSVGNKLKNRLFWDIINAYDEPEKYSNDDIKYIRGLLSFVLSIEKKDFDKHFSDKMIELVHERGFDDIVEMSKALKKE